MGSEVFDLIMAATRWQAWITAVISVKITMVFTLLIGLRLLFEPDRTKARRLGWMALGLGVFGAAYQGLNTWLGTLGTPGPAVPLYPFIFATAWATVLGIIVWLVSRLGRKPLDAASMF
ncbi:putative membrane protein [Asticcacaulis biprosthecium C19]|uniref:Putative membrane protein n=1 Tax=Asticcacaulis biprosthecium C19 TaxID=715226 RepID=F4QRN7_9CAUL|nr:hypothetical protein [Asticcacaulis biprosthecium]EGF90163.1 putative membrane protein [Asticcacaulis biprosthecium C19]